MKRVSKNILTSIVFFIALIAPMVLFHEFGHYLVGKLLGLNPHTFSLGFGPSLLSFDFFHTTWKISAIPLGGYVEFPETAKDNSILWAITCIVGPLFNFIYAIIMIGLISLIRLNSLYAFEGSFRGKTGKIFVFKPSKLLAGPTRAVFVSESSVRLIPLSKQPLNLGSPVPLTSSMSNYIKLIYNLTFKAKRPLYLRALMRYSLQGKNPPKFEASGVLGPLGIISFGKWSYDRSPASFLIACASVSISLGIFNLIPLSFLDGGQALMAILNIKFNAQTITDGQALYLISSAIILGGMFIFAFGSDLWRLLKKITFKKQPGG